MKHLLYSGALLAGLLFAAAPARAQQLYAVNVYTGGIPAWYTWYGYPANMSYYFGPAKTLVTTPMVTVAAPLQTVQVAVPATPAAAVVATTPATEVVATTPEVVCEKPATVKKEVIREDRPARQMVSLNQDRAVIRVLVPSNARLWVQDVLTREKGTERVFLSPPLDRGSRLTYTVKASWQANGREVNRRETVSVRPGQDLTVDLRGRRGEVNQSGLEVLPNP